MKLEIIEKIERELSELDGIFRGEPATDEEIAQAEQTLQVTFDSVYVDFIKRFGGSYYKLSIYAFKNSTMLEARTVTDLTLEFRNGGWPGTEDSYVISIDLAGNPIMIKPDGKVVTFDHDFGGTHIVAESFEALLTD
ncbi:SMI1/KNR4 family protein [Paenibacillus eucommiae]|uniref:Cell wall assembly regulator SMI1 n=1 Tax=Paenibacillus eucommiae TaxID=1355755 RepID=A0ABS4IRC8_9BACL|nr:SMI1/KNR4 family protein [Paenibacillus eucommiae]MBP1990095.1 cell wall assembly regulator SMI1 [Paenibacillus eucommiae]